MAGYRYCGMCGLADSHYTRPFYPGGGCPNGEEPEPPHPVTGVYKQGGYLGVYIAIAAGINVFRPHAGWL